MIKAVLLDLDGTLIDTAADMATALNNLLQEEGQAPLPLEQVRPFVSQGGLVLTRLGFPGMSDEQQIESMRQRYLQHYFAIVADQSKLFDGFETILNELEQRGLDWGIVTNKPEWLTRPLLRQLQLLERAGVVICGDTLARRKPDPLPLIVAAERLQLSSRDCIYVGDDERDIVAGKAAEMKTLAAAYGYIQPGTDIQSWRANAIIDHPLDLLNHLSNESLT